MLFSTKSGNFTKYAHRVRSLKGMSLTDKLLELESLCKSKTPNLSWSNMIWGLTLRSLLDLHACGSQDFIAKCNIVREVLKDIQEQNERPSVETIGNLMHEVSHSVVCALY